MIADCYANTSVKLLILKGILTLLFVAGCAVRQPTAAPDVEFAAKGKLGIKMGGEGYSANFSWQQFARGYSIEVWGPLGQGRTRLWGDTVHMQVIRGGELLAAGPPEVVMQAHLGWSAPIHVLPDWIRGQPDPSLAVAAAVRENGGRLTQFEQAGWLVNFDRFASIDPAARPGRIVARNDDRKITVLVRQFAQ